MKFAVVGHIEWGTFVRVTSVPRQGEIVQSKDSWEEVAGGGSVSAMQLSELAEGCLFFTKIGDDDAGRNALKQLKDAGIEVYATIDSQSETTKAFIYIDQQKERTITVRGNWIPPDGNDTSLPWHKLDGVDAVYFVSGNQAALVAARRAKTVVSTARTLDLLKGSGIYLDALVRSKNDSAEAYFDELHAKAKFVVTTAGINGGMTNNGLSYDAEIIPADELVDTYGCGDSFAAGLTYALGHGQPVTEALSFAASCGAKAARRRGSFGNG